MRVTRRRTAGYGLGLLLAVALAVSATGATVQGQAAAGEIDVRKLDVGKYPVLPLDFREDKYYHSLKKGQSLAIARLAGSVALGTDIDAGLRYGVSRGSIGSRAVDSSSAGLGGVLADATQAVADKHGMMFGFSARSRSTPQRENTYASSALEAEPDSGDTTAVGVTVLQFPDQPRAQAAAVELEQADFGLAPDLNAAVALGKYPAAQGHWRPGVRSMVATMARGQYVVHVYAVTPRPDLAALRSLTERTLDVQLPLLDALPPLSAREMLRQDLDPDGVIRRILDTRGTFTGPTFSGSGNITAVLVPRTFLQITEDRQEWRRVIDLGGIDRIGMINDGALLLRARDRPAAVQVWEARKDLPTTTPLAGPPGLPDTHCFNNAQEDSPAEPYVSMQTKYLCVLHYDRYVAVVMSNQISDVHQRASAQYAMLANSAYL
ncbi:hypothetical protein [Nocardia sp. NPDC058666]|uniref:DUF7373 family lipoprotein n=1 Tax=unclassified Nocardia TaxID=2637762 RepID=UPI00364E7EA2